MGLQIYWPEYVSSFGTHTAENDHLTAGVTSAKVYPADGTLALHGGNSPTVKRYVSISKQIHMETDYCGISHYLQC